MSKLGKTQHAPKEIQQGELTHVSGKKVPFTIVHGWDAKTSMKCDALWKAAWLALFDQIELAEPDLTNRAAILDTISTEDAHWRWFDKAIFHSTDEYEWSHLHAEGKPQAACLIYHPEKSALEPGDIFYVKFVAVAPWNRDCKLQPAQFKGLGKTLLRAAQRFAIDELKLRPGFCLHSLPKAEGFYLKIKMVKVVGKEDAENLAYYELPQALALKLMEAS
jgi:hypothetical protein